MRDSGRQVYCEIKGTEVSDLIEIERSADFGVELSQGGLIMLPASCILSRKMQW